MYSLRIVNDNSSEMTLTNNNDFTIELLDGFYSSSATISTTKAGTKDGERFSSSSINKKNIGIYLKINRNVIQNRINLYKVFQAKSHLTIYYQNQYRDVMIDGYVEDITITPHEIKTNAQIVIVCPTPFFKEIEEIVTELSTVIDNFTFPFAIESAGIPFSYFSTNREKNVFNYGDVPSGLIMELRATDSVVNPIVYNRVTTEFIGIGSTTSPFIMQNGDLITIDTIKKTVTLKRQTVDSNIFNYLRPDTTWLQINVGDNVFTYNATSGINDLTVIFRYRPNYEGV